MSNEKTTFVVRVLNSGPSLNETIHAGAEQYLDAVAAAHRLWRETGRRTRVCSDGSVFTWHYVRADGTFTDRNTNSGVPATGTVAQQETHE